MQANVAGRRAMPGTRIAAAALLATALLGLGSCARTQQKQQELKPPTGTCTTSDGIFTSVTEAWCTEAGGIWKQGYGLLSSPVRLTSVDSIPLAAWHDVTCGDTTEMEYAVKDSAWIEWKFAWLARDSATALANWDSMAYKLTFDDTVALTLPDSLTTRIETASVACGDSTMAGVMVSHILYMEPLFGRQRKVTTTYTFNADVNDGWSTYAKGTSLSVAARLRPKD